MVRKYMLALQALAAIALGVGLSYYLNSPQPRQAPPSLGGDFTLTTTKGKVALHDFKGKVVPIYFGYTHCPDVCPTALYNLAEALEKLDQRERAGIQVLFITLDPERDTAQKVGDYAKHFHPNMLGMTGSQEEINQVTKQYLVIHRKVAMPGSAMEYAIDHSSRLYIVGKDGELDSMLHHGSTLEDTVAYLKESLSK